ncbi:hypothetical protein ACJDT4_22995 [Clostridium neuense]|uniref:Lipoprotein n=1 Tax=Clostridium neuense TaxID=1728934 RepID=A0ABW8TL15_9CLOT
MKKAILITTLLIATVTFSACGNNSNNTKSTSSKSAASTSKKTNLASTSNKTDTSTNTDEVINDIDNWSHPVKDVFSAAGIKINKVELKDNKTYAIFYASLNKELNDDNKAYYSNLVQKVAAANGYWDCEIKDDNKDIDIKVKCKDKKAVDSIDYNKDSKYFMAANTSASSSTTNTVNKDELIDYLKQNVTEVSSFVDTLSKNKNVKPILYIERSPNPSSNDTYLRDYYVIYVGENHTDHNVNIYRFAINKDNKQILYYDTTKNKYETLQEWRDSKK